MLQGLVPSIAVSFKHTLEEAPEEGPDKRMKRDEGQHIAINIANLDSEYTPLLHGYKQNSKYESSPT